MFEKIVKSAFEKITKNKDDVRTFYILTHKKHRREIYFQKGDGNAMNFMKIKFSGFFKGAVYSLFLKTGLLQPFLKKIRLPSDVGQLVFVASQIKIFDFKNKKVISFPVPKEMNKEKFLETKKFQKDMGEKGLAPKIYQINRGEIFSTEELAYPSNASLSASGAAIINYSTTSSFKERVNSKDYIDILKKSLKKQNVNDKDLFYVFYILEKRPIELLKTEVHGDYAKGQILKKDNRFLYTDWEPSKNIITEDLSNSFRDEIDLLSNKDLLNFLKKYPKEVRDNIAYYLILSEIYNVTIKPFYLETAKKKIRKLMRHFS